MYIYQNGKLYIQDGDKLVGVEIYPNQTKIVEGSETQLDETFAILTHHEVCSKFHINSENPYIFPIVKKEKLDEVKEVSEDGNKPTTTKQTKATARKPK